MCGRYNLRADPSQIQEAFDLLRPPDEIRPRYNIAPTQDILVIRQGDGGRECEFMRWGLIPSWSKDAKIGNRLINARGETVDSKPSFRAAFKRRRCLIPASGFYEWKKLDAKSKQPYHIHRRDDRPFAFAGLWEHWNSPSGEEIHSATIITTEANALMAELHDRMPVILDPADCDVWLDDDVADAGALKSLLRPHAADDLRADAIDSRVGNPRNDDAGILERSV